MPLNAISWFNDYEQKDDKDVIHNEVYFSSGLVKFFIELCIPAIGFLSLYYNHYISFSLFLFFFPLHINSSVIFHSKLKVAKLIKDDLWPNLLSSTILGLLSFKLVDDCQVESSKLT